MDASLESRVPFRYSDNMSGSNHKAVILRPHVSIGEAITFGPGKIELLRKVGEGHSISAAARTLGLTYKRAWTLIDTLNRGFGHLTKLESTGLLRALGAGRSRRYVAGRRLVGHIAESAGVSSVVDEEGSLESQRDAITVALAERVKQGGLGL